MEKITFATLENKAKKVRDDIARDTHLTPKEALIRRRIFDEKWYAMKNSHAAKFATKNGNSPWEFLRAVEVARNREECYIDAYEALTGKTIASYQDEQELQAMYDEKWKQDFDCDDEKVGE